MTLTDDELNAIEARAEAATPGPWRIDDDNGGDWPPLLFESVAEGWRDERGHQRPPGTTDYFTIGGAAHEHDAAFITAARTDVPALVAEVRRARELLAGLVAEEPTETHGTYASYCVYCDGEVSGTRAIVLGEHRRFCPWRQAREYLDGSKDANQ